MSEITKKALTASLKKLLVDKSLDKVTIVDITEDCGVNRQTFYYHFQDINAMIEWIYHNEATKALGGKKTYDTWQQGFLQIFNYVLENRVFVIRTYHSSSFNNLQEYLYDETFTLLYDVIEEKSRHMRVREDDKQFIANFYKFAFVGLMLAWVDQGMMEKPEVIIERLSMLLQGDLFLALERFRTDYA